MTSGIGLHDVIALTENLPQHGLVRGQVGTVVDGFPDGAFTIDQAAS